MGFCDLHEFETTNDPAFEFTLWIESAGPPQDPMDFDFILAGRKLDIPGGEFEWHCYLQ